MPLKFSKHCNYTSVVISWELVRALIHNHAKSILIHSNFWFVSEHRTHSPYYFLITLLSLCTMYSNCWIPCHSVPPLFSLVGVLWRTKHNTIDAILIQWHANKWQGILQLSPNPGQGISRTRPNDRSGTSRTLKLLYVRTFVLHSKCINSEYE